MLRTTLTDIAIRALDSTPVSRLLGGLRNQCVPIFMIHRVANSDLNIRGHDLTVIEQALTYLQAHGYQVVTLRNVVERLRNGQQLPSRSVVFTIDDGFVDQTDSIIPIFQKFNAPVTLFVATGLIDEQGWSWDFKLDYLLHRTQEPYIQHRDLLDNDRFALLADSDRKTALRTIRSSLKKQHPDEALKTVNLIAEQLNVSLPAKAPDAFRATSWQRLRSLESNLIEFAPHSVNHVVLSQLSSEEAQSEISRSWQRLEAELEHPVPIFCYPTGRENVDFGKREQQFVEQLGLLGAVSSDPGYVLQPSASQNLFTLPRFSMPANRITEFIKYSSWIERGRQLVTGKV